MREVTNIEKIKRALGINAEVLADEAIWKEFCAAIESESYSGVYEPRKWLIWYKLYISAIVANSDLKKNRLTQLSDWANIGMDNAYLLLNIFNAAIALIQVAHGHLPAEVLAAQNTSSFGWNDYDGNLSWLNVLDQWQYHEYAPAAINALASIQILVFTGLAQNAAAIGLSAAAATAFSGFGFAASMFAALMIECLAIRQCTKNITRINSEIEQIEKLENPSSEALTRKAGLLKSRDLEQALKDNHIRSAKSWLAGALVMTTIATVALLVASGATFGTLPAAIVIVALLGVASGLIRSYWVHRVDHVVRLQHKYFVEHHDLQARLEKISELNCDKKALLQSLFQTAPTKALQVIEAYENKKADPEVIKTILGKHRNSFFRSGFGQLQTTSLKAWVALSQEPVRCSMISQ